MDEYLTFCSGIDIGVIDIRRKLTNILSTNFIPNQAGNFIEWLQSLPPAEVRMKNMWNEKKGRKVVWHISKKTNGIRNKSYENRETDGEKFYVGLHLILGVKDLVKWNGEAYSVINSKM
jgi:hypothetical protein